MRHLRQRSFEEKMYNYRAFHSTLITKDSIGELREIHKRLMAITKPGMEIYAVLANDFVPFLESHSSLKQEFERRAEYEQDPNEFMAYDLFEKTPSFRFVSELLKDSDHRLSNLIDREEFFRAQQFISDVCLELISFADTASKKAVPIEKNKRGKGRPKESQFKNGNIITSMATVKIRSNPPVTRFCKKMFGMPVGKSIHWVDLYVWVYEEHESPPDGWRKLVALIQRINKKMEARGENPIFEFDGVESGKVTRVH